MMQEYCQACAETAYRLIDLGFTPQMVHKASDAVISGYVVITRDVPGRKTPKWGVFSPQMTLEGALEKL